MAGITSSVVVWPPGDEPLPTRKGIGRPALKASRTPERQPVTVKELALSLKPEVFEQVTWRQGWQERWRHHAHPAQKAARAKSQQQCVLG